MTRLCTSCGATVGASECIATLLDDGTLRIDHDHSENPNWPCLVGYVDSGFQSHFAALDGGSDG